MPILERDPWREQYFTDVDCPADVIVPTDDIDAWPLYPKYNWIYDRLRIAQSQGLPAAPHGVKPDYYPVFSKPIVNLRGMGAGSTLIRNAEEMQAALAPGHFWMPYLEGEHLSTDCAVVKGSIAWMRHARGEPAPDGMFHYWVLLGELQRDIAAYLSQWIGTHVADFTGMMNFETIGGRIIEAHLRFADQWVDLNGPGWAKALVGLYQLGQWNWSEQSFRQGFSIPLFVKPDRIYHHPSQNLQAEIRAMPHVSSLQITFHDGLDPRSHPMPPGGMRLALINCWDLAAGRAALKRLATAFPADALVTP